MVHEIRYHEFAILHEETGLRHTTVTKQLLTANNIFKATALTYFSSSQGTEKVP